MNKAKIIAGLKFGGAVVATLFAISLIKKYVLPKAPAVVQNAAKVVLPS